MAARGAGATTSVPVVGVLSSQSQGSETAVLGAWRQGMEATGYFEGRNAAFEFRFADGRGERLPALAAELIRRQIAVIAAGATPAAFAWL